MKQIKRILIVTPWYPTTQNPAAATFVKDQAEILSNYFNSINDGFLYKFIVLHFQVPLDLPSIIRGKRPFNKFKEESDVVIPVFHKQPIIPTHRIGLGKTFFSKRLLFKSYKKCIDKLEGPPDIILGVTLSGLMDGWEIINHFKLKDVPLIMHEHSVPITMHTRTDHRKELAKKALDAASSIIIVANRQKKEIDDLKAGKVIQLVPNPAHQIYFDSELVLNKTQPYIHIVSVGRLTYQKAQDKLILAVSLLKKKQITIKLSIAGDGEDKGRLIALTQKLGLESDISFLGSKSKQEIINLFNTAHIFALPSRYENCPVVMAEAQAMGLPIICSKNNASEFILLDGNGIAVEQDETGEYIAQGLEKMITNLHNYNPEEIRKKASAFFSPTKFGEKFYRILNQKIG